eukprot:6209892-Alexandrium_andersonii.AAC.1
MLRSLNPPATVIVRLEEQPEEAVEPARPTGQGRPLRLGIGECLRRPRTGCRVPTEAREARRFQ